MTEDEVMQTRMQLEKSYANKWQEGRRMRKNTDQMVILNKYFDENPVWSFKVKMEIAAQIDMTPNQVSKWNWDRRKNLGMSTARSKKKV